ncbi:MAG: septum formation initiator family protein [Oscillospiraceae bacterium]|nr:septum formation initiator family protein [Oscillospiraceae bacterium]
MASKTRSSKKSKNILLSLVLLIFAGYIIYSIFSTQIDIANKKAELAKLSAQVQEVELSNEEMQGLLDSCDTEAYIERIAREKLDYVYPGERVYVDRSGK